ncbi:MAG: hypothetical protein IV105_17910 [Rhizobacter sp.]|nr:hypothetical protein [Rhizobacter sp.]
MFPSGDSALVLVANKAVLVRVNAITTNAQEAKPAGVLRVETSTGQLVQQLALTAPTGSLPSAVPAAPTSTNAYSAVVPANLVRTGLRLTASLANGQPPTTVNPRVGGGVAMRLVAVPIQIAGTAGQVVSGPASYLQARAPLASVTLQVHAPYVPRGVTALPTTEDEWDTAFGKVLSELSNLHMLEQASDESYYYGFMPKRTYGLSGLGYRPGNAAVGFDLPSNPTAVRETLAHELGHNFSLPHAPCGGPANPDPDYPYANAQLGATGRYIWGYNFETSTFVDPRRTNIHDMMSYCDGDTFSDYNYRKIQVYLTPADRSVQVASASGAVSVASGPQELLLVSGQIAAGKAEFMPAKSLFGEPRLPQRGPYTLRIVTAQGVVEYPFATRELDHVASAQHFGFTIPHPGSIFSMSVVKDGQTLTQSEARRATAASATTQTERAASAGMQLQVSEQAGVLRLSWDHARYPYLTVTHLGAQRSTLAQDLQGGSAALPLGSLPAGGSYEFSLSDGLNTVRVTRAR